MKRLATTMSRAAPACLAAALTACGPGGAPVPGHAVVDSAGVTLVTNHDAAWSDGRGWRVEPQPVQKIGVVEGEEVYQFSVISAAARQSDSDIVVADARTGAVRLYGPDGMWKKTIGRGGSAPGEFRVPAALAIGAADSVFVWDEAAWRLTRFDAEGELSSVEVVNPLELSEAVAPPLYAGSARPLSDGSLLVRLVEKSVGVKGATAQTKKGDVRGGPSGGSTFRPRSGVLRVSPDRQRRDVLDYFADVEQVTVEAPWGQATLTPPLARGTSIAASPDGTRVCVGDQAAPEVRCTRHDGAVLVIRWPDEPVAVGANEAAITGWREATLDAYGLKISRADARRVIDLVPLPATRPAFTSLLLDGSGHLWVERGPVPRRGSRANEFLVFDPAGALLGTVALPAIRVLEIGEDRVLGVREDALGVQVLELYALDRTAAGDAPHRRNAQNRANLREHAGRGAPAGRAGHRSAGDPEPAVRTQAHRCGDDPGDDGHDRLREPPPRR